MPQASLRIIGQVGGITFNTAVNRSADGQVGQEITIPAAKAGTLSTRTDANTGVATIGASHGITTADTVAVFWATGRRQGMTVTSVGGTTVNIDGGTGDDLPLATTEITVAKEVEIDFTINADNLPLFLMTSNRRGAMRFIDEADASAGLYDIVAGEPIGSWYTAGVTTMPEFLDGKTLAKVIVSNADSANTALFQLGMLYDSTP